MWWKDESQWAYLQIRVDIREAFFPHEDSEAVKQGPREVVHSLSLEFFKTQWDLESTK